MRSMIQTKSGTELSIYRAIANCLRKILLKKEKTVIDYIRQLIYRKKTILFIQVGGCDCGLNDPLSEFILQGKAKGLIIEPIAEYLIKAKKKYKEKKGITFSNCAIDVKKGTRMIYRIKKVPGLPKWAYQVCSFSRRVVLAHKRDIPEIEKLIKKERVTTSPLKVLLKQKELETPDLLLVDTEGHDDKIIKMFPFQKHRPDLVIFEHKHLTETRKQSICKKLANSGYYIKEVNTDTVALKNKG
jgi:FkbM family methyltransferase